MIEKIERLMEMRDEIIIHEIMEHEMIRERG